MMIFVIVLMFLVEAYHMLRLLDAVVLARDNRTGIWLWLQYRLSDLFGDENKIITFSIAALVLIAITLICVFAIKRFKLNSKIIAVIYVAVYIAVIYSGANDIALRIPLLLANTALIASSIVDRVRTRDEF